MLNRLLIEDSEEVMAFLDGVFDQDFAQAVPWVTISYDASGIKEREREKERKRERKRN